MSLNRANVSPIPFIRHARQVPSRIPARGDLCAVFEIGAIIITPPPILIKLYERPAVAQSGEMLCRAHTRSPGLQWVAAPARNDAIIPSYPTPNIYESNLCCDFSSRLYIILFIQIILSSIRPAAGREERNVR
jgi:hypothetical protein